MKHQIQDKVGRTWEFDTADGRLEHPCNLLTSWLRDDRPRQWWTMLEAADTVPDEVLRRINQLECGGDPARRYRQDSPEAEPIIQEIDAIERKARALHAELHVDLVSHIFPSEMLTALERERLYDLQMMIRPKSQKEAAENICVRRIRRLQTLPRHSAQQLVVLVTTAGRHRQIGTPEWLRDVMVALAPLWPDVVAKVFWQQVEGRDMAEHLKGILAIWEPVEGVDAQNQQRAVALMLACVLGWQHMQAATAVKAPEDVKTESET